MSATNWLKGTDRWRRLGGGRTGLSRAPLPTEMPFPHRQRLSPPFHPFQAKGWVARLPELAWMSDLPTLDRSRLELLEDGVPVAPAHAAHTDLGRDGGGAYSHWGVDLYFSSTDGSDPNTNGREYRIEVPAPPRWSPPHWGRCFLHGHQVAMLDELLRVDLEVFADDDRIRSLALVSRSGLDVLDEGQSRDAPVLSHVFAFRPGQFLRRLWTARIPELSPLVASPIDRVSRSLGAVDGCAIQVALQSGEVVTAPLLDVAVSHWSYVDFVYDHLVDLMRQQGSGVLLEIGGRGEQSQAMRQEVGGGWRYLALDIKDGPNVDVVGDVHTMSTVVEPGSIDVVFSRSVLEHLHMPWRAVLEIGKVLRSGGLCYTHTPYFWPVHEEPWDFFRPSRHAWSSLFNEATGFRLLKTQDLGISRPVGQVANRHAVEASFGTGPMATVALACKVADSPLSWDGYRLDRVPGMYPG